jgi:hypothetical protein
LQVLGLVLALVVVVLVLARVLVASVPCQSLLQTSRLLGASQVCQSPHRHAWMQRSHHCPLALQRLPRLPLQLPWSGLQAHHRFPRFATPLLMCLCACTLAVWISVRRQLVFLTPMRCTSMLSAQSRRCLAKERVQWMDSRGRAAVLPQLGNLQLEGHKGQRGQRGLLGQRCVHHLLPGIGLVFLAQHTNTHFLSWMCGLWPTIRIPRTAPPPHSTSLSRCVLAVVTPL